MSKRNVYCSKGDDDKCLLVEANYCCASMEMTKEPAGLTQSEKDLAKTAAGLAGTPASVGDVSYICTPVATIEALTDGMQEGGGYAYKWECTGSVMIQAFVAIATAAAATSF